MINTQEKEFIKSRIVLPEKADLLDVKEIFILQNGHIKTRRFEGFPYLVIETSTSGHRLDYSMINDGWEPHKYNKEENKYIYTKKVDVRDIIKTLTIVFNKQSDTRDIKSLMLPNEVMCGIMRYYIPTDLIEPIACEMYKASGEYKGFTDLSYNLKSTILDCLVPDLIDDEYMYLKELKETVEKSLFIAYGLGHSTKAEQQSAFERVIDTIKSPVLDSKIGSRSTFIINRELERAYKAAKLL